MPWTTWPIISAILRAFFSSWWRVVGISLLLTSHEGELWAQTKIYTWTDKNGVVHFADSVISPQDFDKVKTITSSPRRPLSTSKTGGDEIPLLLFDDRPSQKFVRAQLEGERGLREVLMLVDTGAQISLIDQELAAELDLEHVQDAELHGVTGASQGWIGNLSSLRLGGEEIRDLPIMVGPRPGLVLLGMDVLERLKLSVGPRSLQRNK